MPNSDQLRYMAVTGDTTLALRAYVQHCVAKALYTILVSEMEAEVAAMSEEEFLKFCQRVLAEEA